MKAAQALDPLTPRMGHWLADLVGKVRGAVLPLVYLDHRWSGGADGLYSGLRKVGTLTAQCFQSSFCGQWKSRQCRPSVILTLGKKRHRRLLSVSSRPAKSSQ